MARTYKSEVREARTAQMRELLLQTTHAILAAGGLDALTLPKLAAEAEVSVPTVYRHFATLDELLGAFLGWMRPKVGMTHEAMGALKPDEVAALAPQNFPRFDAHKEVLEPLMDSRAWNRVRTGSLNGRAQLGASILRPAAPDWPQADLEAASGAIMILSTPAAWRWLRDTWGLDSATAARGAEWAMRTLIASLATTSGFTAPPAAAKAKTAKSTKARAQSAKAESAAAKKRR